MIDRSKTLVSTDWLARRLGDPAVAIVDASWYLPAANRDAVAEFREGHIPGAVFFDVDGIADQSSGLPHMLLGPDAFAAAVGALGISDDQTIVVYDGAGLFSAPRVWWTFRVMGARDVRILDGGLPQWKAEGRPLQTGDAKPTPHRFTPHFDAAAVASVEDVRRRLADGSAQVVDARSAERFRGDAPEPRPGVRSGHMPGARNVPFGEVVEGGRLKPPAEIEAAFAAAGVDPGKPIVTSCGSGVTAAVLALALGTIGADNVALYDGSWSEWGSRSDTPVATGPAD